MNNKLNYVFKKLLNKPNTLINESYIQEPSIIDNNPIISNVSIYSQNNLYRDVIPNTLQVSLQNSNHDDNGNTLEGSLIGKTIDNITKFDKLQMKYINGSEVKDHQSNIIGISFFLKELRNSIPFTFDPYGSYTTLLYRYDNVLQTYTEVFNSEGDWIVDHDSGVLTFYDAMNNNISTNQHISKTNPPYISFYKYAGNIGLYPLVFTQNSLITVESNLNVNNNLNVIDNTIIHKDCIVKKNLSVQNNVSLSGIFFDKLNELPNNSPNKLVYVTDTLYFNKNNEWIKLTDKEEFIKYNNEQFIFDHNNIYNILNINTNVSVIEITQNIFSTIYVVLPIVQQTGIEKTIIIGQSFSHYNNGQNIILYSKFMDVDGNGPVFMNIKFISTGQSIKLMSVNSETSNIYGTGNKYWQIINGNFDSTDVFEYNSNGDIINTNDSSTIFQANVNNIQYNSLSSIQTPIRDNILFNTYIININGSNNLDLNSGIILLELNNYLTQNITINLPLETISGEKKTILVGSSFETYKSTYHILIKSTFLGGYNIEFLSSITEKNIKFIKSGQSITLMSISNSNSYWHILNGDFEFI